MVKTVRAAVLAAAALACLASCSLGASIFPDRLMGYEAYADLERFIDPDHVGDYDLQIIRNSSSGAEYLVLASDDGSFGDDCVVVFDADLKVLGHYTLDQLDAMDAANPYNGDGAMVDESGCIVVGNRRFTVGSRQLAYLDTPPGLSALYHLGLAVPNAFDRNLANIHADALNLEFDRYDVDWTFMAPVSLQLSAEPWHEVVGAWVTAAQVLLVVRHDPDPDVAHVLAMGDVAFATGGLSVPLLTFYGSTVPTQDDVDWDTLGYTDEGFAAFRWTATPEYFRFDEFGIELGASGEIPEGKRPDRQRHCYGRASGWYVMDLDAMSLERRKWWWK
jgi:hypothetical protein